MPFTPEEIHRLPTVLSAPRFATYLAEKASDKEAALELYRWNMEVSAAFFVPLQICEVSVRNSIVSAIENTYGANWPWEKGFEISLRNPQRGYSPRRDLTDLARRLPTAGKIVAELKFVFWERMFTLSHDKTIWNSQLMAVFPNADPAKTVQQLRGEGFDKLQRIRDLRNRIAHHEPIFRRNVQQEYDRIRSIVAWTDVTTADWLDKVETVTSMIATKP
ncbi:hypothetical protein [Rhizobium phaseoli]|uniref:hypothetical protein n=1 Tax=Rhizobium phaseoli TaxID=396 RepID=UPI0019534E05|nr:hypothetical protein [Rhizobium phaseoli]